MNTIALEEFDKFVIYSKTLELLERYGIQPPNIDVGLELSQKQNQIRWGLFDRTVTYSDDLGSDPIITNAEQHDRIKQLYADLGEGLGVDGVDTILFTSYEQLYNKLSAAIEKAPKSFTKFR